MATGTSATAPGGAKRPPAKARRSASASKPRSRGRLKKSSAKGDSGSASSPSAAAATAFPLVPPGPTPTLILDTGGWTVKHGLVVVDPKAAGGGAGPYPVGSGTPPSLDAIQVPPAAATAENEVPRLRQRPRSSPNATARLRHQLTVLAADELGTVRNQGQLEVTRPLERGYATDLGCQLRVWKRVCDAEGVDARPPPGHPVDPAVANLLGIGSVPSSAAKKKRAAAAAAAVPGSAISPPPPTCSGRDCAVLLLTQPFTPRSVSERVDEVWFRDLGFARVGRRLVQSMAAYRYLSLLGRPRPILRPAADANANADSGGGSASAGGAKASAAVADDGGATSAAAAAVEEDGDEVMDDGTRCCLVVDSGFSLTHVVPTVEARAVSKAIRRLNVGGKLLTNLLKEAVSYRQWNMMDEFPIVNEAKEALCFVSDDFDREMRDARNVRRGFRRFDRDFVLPDFVDTFRGEVRLPLPLQREKDREEAEAAAAAAAIAINVGEAQKDALEKEHGEDAKDGPADRDSDGDNDDGGDSGDGDGGDSDEETEEQRRRRVLRQREEERRHRELEERERQVLSLSVERFAVPEALFRPSDVGLDQGGVAEAIVQAAGACDPRLRAAMYRNVLLVGGNALLPGYRRRLERELRALAPANYEVRVCLPADPVGYTWKGAREFARRDDLFGTCCVDRAEWEANKKGAWSKIEERHASDGMIIF